MPPYRRSTRRYTTRRRPRRYSARRTSYRQAPLYRQPYRTGRVMRSMRPSRRAQSTRVAYNCDCPSQPTPGEKFVMAQADPFEPKYFGGKIPDSSTIPSVSTPIQCNFPLTTAAASLPSSSHAWAFYPSVYGSQVAATGNSPSAWVFSTGAVTISSMPQATSFSSQFEASRPVAHAIRLSCPFAPTNTTGFVHIALATETSMGSLNTGVVPYTQLAANLTQISGYTFYKRVTLASLTQSPITLINKWTDETAFRYSSTFSSPSQAGAADTNPNTFQIPLSWGCLLVAVEGVSTSSTPGSITPLQAEVVLHTEAIPDKSSTLIGSTAAAFSSSTLNSVSQAVANTDFAHTEDEQDSTIRTYAQEVMNATGITSQDVSNAGAAVARFAAREGLRFIYNRGRAYGGVPRGIGGVNNLPNRLLIE